MMMRMLQLIAIIKDKSKNIRLWHSQLFHAKDHTTSVEPLQPPTMTTRGIVLSVLSYILVSDEIFESTRAYFHVIQSDDDQDNENVLLCVLG